MKRVGLWAIGIGVLASVGLLTVAQGFADGNDGATKCTVKTLKGRYLFGGGSATLFPPAFGVKEVSVGSAAGYHIFDGNGGGQDYVTFTVNGIDQNVPSPNQLTYTLNPDCTGTYAVLPLGVGFPTFDYIRLAQWRRDDLNQYRSSGRRRLVSPEQAGGAQIETRSKAGGW
jgi:hypothetical protein